MRYGLILGNRDMQNILHEYELTFDEVEEYDEEDLKKIIAKYFSTSPQCILKTNKGYIVLNREEEGD